MVRALPILNRVKVALPRLTQNVAEQVSTFFFFLCSFLKPCFYSQNCHGPILTLDPKKRLAKNLRVLDQDCEVCILRAAEF